LLSLSQLEQVSLGCTAGGWVLADRCMHAGLLWCSCGGSVPGVYAGVSAWCAPPMQLCMGVVQLGNHGPVLCL
jgi:hypothetical protein